MRFKSVPLLFILHFLFYAAIAQKQLDSLTAAQLSTQIGRVVIKNNQLVIPKIKGYSLALIGSDNKVVIDLKGKVNQPLLDKKVNLLFKVIRDKDQKNAEIPVKDIIVKGQYNDSGIGNAPFVIPTLREWYGLKGEFVISDKTDIVLEESTADNQELAKLLKSDLEKIVGYTINIKVGAPKSGDIFIKESKQVNYLGEEGYMLDVKDVMTITAAHYKGKVFATRTILQLLTNGKTKINSIQWAYIRDYPTYEVRSFMIDVARKFFTLDFLNDYVEILSYYKMSNFHIHLNDNGFKQYFNNNWDSTYTAFRLESTTYPNLTSKDGFYTKQQFVDLQKKALKYGVTIIPEIDVPAHALSFAHMMPELGSKKYGMDHLDLENPKTYEVVKNVFDEYTKGANPTFIGEEVHIGTDEYDKSQAENFRKFTDFLIKTVQANGKKVRAWGALTHAQGETFVTTKDVTLNMWYNGYADPIAMKELGYPQISTPDGWLYIVPFAGYYYDYLNTNNIYNNWDPRKVGNVTFEKGDPIIRGGSFAVWNDIVGNGISEKDVHNRVFPAVQTLAEKMWTGEDQSISLYEFNQQREYVFEAPGINLRGIHASSSPYLINVKFEGDVDNSAGGHMSGIGASNVEYVVAKKGMGVYFPDSTASLNFPINEIGGEYSISFWIKPKNSDMGKMFTSKNATVFSSDKGLGYMRDGYTFYFDKYLEAEKWTHIVITGNALETSLYLDGRLAKKMDPIEVVMPNKTNDGKDIKYRKIRTLVFPLSQFAAKEAVVDELKVFTRQLTLAEVTSEYQLNQ